MARILIVDDSPSQLVGLKRIVEKLGHQAITAEDGAAGVEAAKREVPDLILMDVVMPNLNGFQATRTIAKDSKTSHILGFDSSFCGNSPTCNRTSRRQVALIGIDWTPHPIRLD